MKAAVVCGSPWNLEVSSLALQRTWLGLGIYSRVMGSNMKKLFELYAKETLWDMRRECSNADAFKSSHVEEISKNPRIDVEKVRGVKYLHEFDRLESLSAPLPLGYMCLLCMGGERVVQGPSWGYPTEGAYYRDASSSDSVLAVKIPLFVIQAEDDPVCDSLPILRLGNANTRLDRCKRSHPHRRDQAEPPCRSLHHVWWRTPQLVSIGW